MNPQQRAAVRRKVFYFGAILAIFTVSIFYRGLDAQTPEGVPYVWVPFGRDDRAPADAPTPLHRAADWAARKTILSQSRRAELREVEQGEAEVSGEAIRLGLVGSRGLVVTYLWNAAIDKQKRNDFHEFQLLVKTITKLQPHFLQPWLYQSWNIAYNVSVEMHSLGDMYFYIAEGVRLLAEGERRMQRSPDMRDMIAYYYSNKFGVSDQVQTLRCLYELSCIPVQQRNPDDLLQPDGKVNVAAFRAFCEKHPHLVRRLRGEERQETSREGLDSSAAQKLDQQNRERLRCRDKEDVVKFLRDNRTIPTRYDAYGKLARPGDQFPIFPPQFDEGPGELNPKMETVEGMSAFDAARAWCTYANVLVPPQPNFPDVVQDVATGPMPSPSPRPGPPGTTNPMEYDPLKYRLPRKPMLIIFRLGGPRNQTAVAEMEQKDGWFDEGWEVDARSDTGSRWFPGKLDYTPLEPLPGDTADQVRYRITFRNTGENSAVALSNVVIRIAVPTDAADVVRADPPPDPKASSPGVPTWTVASLARGAEWPAADKPLELVLRKKTAAVPRPVVEPPAFEPERVVVGKEPGHSWALQAWRKAWEMWEVHGRKYALILDRVVEGKLRAEGGGRPVNWNPTDEQMANPAYARRHWLTLAWVMYQQNRSVTGFAHFYAAAQAEQATAPSTRKPGDETPPSTTDVRKILWKADQARRAGLREQAIALYDQGLTEWKKVLWKYPAFHRPDGGTRTEEETYEAEIEFVRLLSRYSPASEQSRAPADVLGRKIREAVNQRGAGIVRALSGIAGGAATATLTDPIPVPLPERTTAQGAVIPFLPELTAEQRYPTASPIWTKEFVEALKWDAAETTASPFAGPIPSNHELEQFRGTPWISEAAREAIRSRQNVRRPGAPAQPQPQQSPGGQPGPGGGP